MSIRMLGERIAVRPDVTEYTSDGGIQLLSALDKVNTGTVVSVGPGKYKKDGTLSPVPVSVGTRVIYMTTNEQDVEIDDEKLVIITADDILSAINDEG